MSMSDKDPQEKHFSDIAAIARTLGNVQRLMLLEHVAQGERPVDRLAGLCGLSIANASQHLQHLKRAGFVKSRRQGKHVLYRLGDGPVAYLLSVLTQYAEHNRAEILALVSGRAATQEETEAISRAELLRRLKDGDVVLLDVRPEEEYALGHLPGAVNVPIEELENRLADLPADQEIIAYCRGSYCVFSADAVSALRAKGFRARRFLESVPDWSAAGLYVETAPRSEGRLS